MTMPLSAGENQPAAKTASTKLYMDRNRLPKAGPHMTRTAAVWFQPAGAVARAIPLGCGSGQIQKRRPCGRIQINHEDRHECAVDDRLPYLLILIIFQAKR
jgi:hypothetical protein